MSASSNPILDEFINSNVDALLEDDVYYQAMSTPLKSAESIKREQRAQLVEFLQMKNLRESVEKAEKFIRENLSSVITPQEFDKVMAEFDHVEEHISQFVDSTKELGDQPVLMKDVYGISDESLKHIYALIKHCVHEKKHEEAQHLLTFLTTLAPNVPGYWLALGICFQALNQHDKAIEAFNITKALDSTDPAPFVYAAESYHSLKMNDQAKHEIEGAQHLLQENANDQLKTAADNIKKMLA